MLSPTMSTEGLMLLFMIDAMEGREVATSDIPGSFLHTNYDKGRYTYQSGRGDGHPTQVDRPVFL